MFVQRVEPLSGVSPPPGSDKRRTRAPAR